MIITIDGPAGTGKTTVARTVAQKLAFPYFDTGAMYRSVTWKLLQEKVGLKDIEAVCKVLHHFDFVIRGVGSDKRYFVDGIDITEEIRGKEVTSRVSEVSAIPAVREKLWVIQKDFGAKGDAVFEGRDMGTVVFPHADIKIFLTASPEVRAKRRLDEILKKTNKTATEGEYQLMMQELIQRDEYDSNREIAPLKKPIDAYEIDTSCYTIDEVVDLILNYKLSRS